jgi:hypothetical protein
MGIVGSESLFRSSLVTIFTWGWIEETQPSGCAGFVLAAVVHAG